MLRNRNNLIYVNLALLATTMAAGALFYRQASRQAKAMASELEQIGNSYIEYTAVIRDTIPLFSDVSILNETPVHLDMRLNNTLPVKFTQTVTDSFSLPVKLQVKDVLSVDTVLTIPSDMQLLAEGNIPIDQKITMSGLGNMKMRTRAQIPLSQVLNVKMLNSPTFSTHIPVTMNIDQRIPVKLDLKLPVDQRIAVNMPIRSMAKVSFPGKVKILGYIPIELEVPVRIPLANTPLKIHLDKAAEHLKEMF